MTREEAINEIKSWDFLEGKEIEAIQTLIPELAESEEENLKNNSGYYKAGKFWKASTLWNATKDKIPQRVPNRYILQGCTWNIGSLQEFANEVKNVQEVSLDYPIILDMNGNILDGAHRVVKAYLEGKDIDIVYLGDDEWPEPDYDEEKAVKESKDERIIRAIIDALYSHTNSINLLSSRGYQMEDIEAWFEKQKEQKPADLSEMMVHKEPYIAPVPTPMVADEQKSAEPSGKLSREEYLYQLLIDQLITYSDYEYLTGKNPAWSEEDEKMLENIRYALRYAFDKQTAEYVMTWLKSLPERFNLQPKAEWAEEEKTRFVSGQFLQCKLSFDEFKEGEHYWLEYVGDDMYVGRSDNILNQKFHITPRQLFTLFSQKLEEVQGPPQEEKQVSLNYEPPFNENPSDNEIIEALIKNLKEQDGFLTAIGCVSTKAILSWLEKHLNNNSLI